MTRSAALKSVVILSVGIFSIGFSSAGLGLSVVESEPSSMAIGLFNQGYRHCQAAHRQRSRDIKGAQRKFQLYLDYLAQATAEDVRVSTTSANNIDRSIAYCNQVKEDLTRVLATPTLEKSYASCKTAKRFLADFDVSLAEKHFNAHLQLKFKALQMSPDLLSRTLAQTWTQEGERLCKRVKLNIKRLGNRLARINLDMPVVEEHLNAAVRQCSVARKSVNEQAKVASLEEGLNQVQRAIRQAKEYESIWTYARSRENHDHSKSLLKSLAVSNWCEHQLSKEIGNLITHENNQRLIAAQAAIKQQSIAEQRVLETQHQNLNGSLEVIELKTFIPPLIVAHERELGGDVESTLSPQTGFNREGQLWDAWMGFEVIDALLLTAVAERAEGSGLDEFRAIAVKNIAVEMSVLAKQKSVSDLVFVNSNALARRAPALTR